MSEFDRSENSRRFVRRKKIQAPLPPVSQLSNPLQCSETNSSQHFDESKEVLKKIQSQINRLEIDCSENLTDQFQTTAKKTFDTLNLQVESLNFTQLCEGNSVSTKPSVNDKIIRSFLRSSMQTSRKEKEEDSMCRTKLLQRTQSDTKKVEMLVKRIKQRELIKQLDEKVKDFDSEAKIHKTDKIKFVVKIILQTSQ
jgi:hypothetical protein